MEATSKCRPSTGASLQSRPPTALKLVSNRPELKNPASKNVQSQAREVHAKGAPINKPRPGVAEARKGSGGITTNGSGRPVGHRDLPSNRPVQVAGAYLPPSRGLKGCLAVSVVPHSSTQKISYSEQRKPNGGMDRVKAETKQPLPSSKPSIPKPQKQIPHRHALEDRPKKKLVKRRFDEEDDEEDAIGLIRKMFSSKIAKEEDEEQLRLIEEEEWRERMRKKQKQSRG